MGNNKSLLLKLAAIQQEGVVVGKSGYNAFHKYYYVTEADIVSAVGSALNKQGILLNTTMEDVQIVMNGDKPITRVKMRFTLLDSETGESLESVFYGDGEDKNDKGIFKAVTGASKYFLLKTFMVGTEDDAERDASVTRTNNNSTNTEVKKPSSFKKPGAPETNNDVEWS